MFLQTQELTKSMEDADVSDALRVKLYELAFTCFTTRTSGQPQEFTLELVSFFGFAPTNFLSLF